MKIRIIKNQAKCLKCNDIIVSMHRHDYVTCSCQSISVDGGTAYLRRLGDPHHIQEMSVYSNSPFEVIRENLYWGSHGKDGDQPLKWLTIAEMETEHLQAIIDLNLGDEWIRDYVKQELEYRKI